MKKSRLLILLFVLQIGWISAQNEKAIQVSFLPLFDGSTILLDNAFYKLDSGDSVQFQTVKFYVSDIQLLKGEMLVWKEPVSFHLVDIENPKSCLISLNVNTNLDFNQIRFRLGIDSMTNSSGAMAGDLDPTKGMYWTWDNGYINAKIEGKSNRCPTRNHEFQLHVGGFRKAVNTDRNVTLSLADSAKIRILLDLKPVLNSIDLAKTHHIMSAGKWGVLLADALAQNIKLE